MTKVTSLWWWIPSIPYISRPVWTISIFDGQTPSVLSATIANSRRKYWYISNNKAVIWALNKERLINSGYYDLATAYQSVHVNYWKRRIPNGTYGAVRGRQLITASYSIDNEFYVIQILELFYVEIIIFPVIFNDQTPSGRRLLDAICPIDPNVTQLCLIWTCNYVQFYFATLGNFILQQTLQTIIIIRINLINAIIS